ncbi:ParA family protein [Paraburkholderia sp. SARCC-3016]|uniref:ParA family protein n=1 Tax=Paraburkholderia sp. SARCC-3016 TaxID=3058611 RepID=UPI00280A0273|nr:ParA family protein [Paraburkholderia sp. SARCC-3016]MDQ7980381.1 ParA family protein [Paraburkholderia sp. SARCC-3016]
MPNKPYKVQAAAQLLATTTDTVRRMIDESGVQVMRQESGSKTRLFSIENIFELAAYRANRRKLKSVRKDPVVVTMYAPKRGFGTTMFASNFGILFSLKGFRTLIIDLDFQAKLTHNFGYDSELTPEEAAEGTNPTKLVEYHFGHVTPNYPMGRVALHKVIKKPFGEYGPHVVPADLSLDKLDEVLTYGTTEGKSNDLAFARLIMEGSSKEDENFDVSNYDIVLFDAAPAMNRITRSALLAADYVVSPVSIENFSSKGLAYLSNAMKEIKSQSERNPELILVGNFFDPNRVRVMGRLMAITQTYEDAWLDHSIQSSEDFSKALNGGLDLPLVLSLPGSQTAAELSASADELLVRMGLIDE